VGVTGAEVALVVLVPGLEAIPEKLPGVTQAGNLSLRAIPKKTRAAFYVEVVAGYVLVTIREALAVAPNIISARVVAIRTPGLDAYGKPRVECLMATRIPRAALNGVRWDLADAATVLNDTKTDLVISQKGQAKEITPLDLTAEPELADLLACVDVTELTADHNR
jgi:hypothetical protein